MHSTARSICLALATLLVAAAAAEPATIRVSTTDQLKAALATAHTDPGRIIELRPGRYPFSGYSLFSLGPFEAGRPIRGLTIRGLGAGPRDVVLAGTGMDPRPDVNTGYGFVLIDALDVTFENFEIRDVRTHLFALKGERGYADRTTFRRLRLVNAGEQFIKGTLTEFHRATSAASVAYVPLWTVPLRITRSAALSSRTFASVSASQYPARKSTV